MRTILCCMAAIMFCLAGTAQNVGIGTDNPGEKLDINGGIRLGFSPSLYSAGAMRYNNGIVEYNTGYNWRSLVNAYKDSALSGLTPFSTTVRNSYVQVPGVSMTATEFGTYLIVFKVNGYNNTVYYPGSGNADDAGYASLRLNGGTLGTRNFILPYDTYASAASNRRDFRSHPVEFSSIQQLMPGDKLSIHVLMLSTGSTPNPWIVNEAQIMLIRLY